MKKTLIVGSGGREHALAWKLARDGWSVESAPGNPGMQQIGECHPVKAADIGGICRLVESARFDLVVVGPEAPLTMGLADELHRRGVPVFGPSAAAARIEGSKVFAKELMGRKGVPTARFEVFDAADQARRFVEAAAFGYPVVLKADGLAAGKGVVVAAGRDEAYAAIASMMEQGKLGASGRRIIIEECLRGPEISYFALAYGKGAVPIGTAQDYKRLLDGDRGPNTGGMGSLSPSPIMTEELSGSIMERIVLPVLEGLREEGSEYRGLLYAGLMMTADGPKVLEFNCRFGDPETQPLVLTLGDGLGDALLAAAHGIEPRPPRPAATKAVCVVLASRGYPEEPETGKTIQGLDSVPVGKAVVFQAATASRAGELVTSGGRVLSVCAAGSTYTEARGIVDDAVSAISFDGMQHRRDIGRLEGEA